MADVKEESPIEMVARIMHVSQGTIRRASAIKRKDPALFEKMKRGEISIADASRRLKMKQRSWRDVYKIHPAADVFPLMGRAELKELAEDIHKNGLHTKIQLWKDADGTTYIIDGRNRLDAMEMVGIVPWDKRGNLELGTYELEASDVADVATKVIGLNVRRRHLTAAERAALTVKAFEAQKKFKTNHRAILHDAHHHAKGVSGSVKGEAGKVAAAAGVSKHVALEQIAVAADPELKAKVDAREMTAAQAGRVVRERSIALEGTVIQDRPTTKSAVPGVAKVVSKLQVMLSQFPDDYKRAFLEELKRYVADWLANLQKGKAAAR